MRDLNIIRSKKGFISDMDGVIYQGSTLIPGVKDFVNWLQKEKKQFLFLTNSSERTPLELRKKLQSMGLDVEESHFYTSALATAHFLKTQAPGCSAYIIGAHGLINALYEVGIPFNDVNPEYVVVGETTGYNYEMIIKATELINKGAKLIGTNGDMTKTVSIPDSTPPMMSVSIRSPIMTASSEWTPSFFKPVRIINGFGLPMK